MYQINLNLPIEKSCKETLELLKLRLNLDLNREIQMIFTLIDRSLNYHLLKTEEIYLVLTTKLKILQEKCIIII